MNERMMETARAAYAANVGSDPAMMAAFDAGWRAASPPIPPTPDKAEREVLMEKPAHDYMAGVAIVEPSMTDATFATVDRHVRQFWASVRRQGLARCYGQRIHPAYSVKVAVTVNGDPDLVALYAHDEFGVRGLVGSFEAEDIVAVERWNGDRWVEVTL